MSDLGEILKPIAGSVEHLTGLLEKLAGPAAQEVGLMLGERLRAYRLKNLGTVAQKMERKLCDAGLPVNAVPPRLLLPIIENSSIEDNDSLQELWAGLLATASHQTDSVSPAFVETLKQLTPDEARHLKHIYDSLLAAMPSHLLKLGMRTPITPFAFTKAWGAPAGVTADSFERLSLVQRDFAVKLWQSSSRFRNAEEALNSLEPRVEYRFVFTQYALNFLEACQGPSRPDAEQSANVKT